METKGFYKYEDSEIYYAPNFVKSANYELLKELKDTYNYPVYGWYWFNSEEEANAALVNQ